LDDLKINPKEFSLKVLSLLEKEMASIEEASMKVKSV